MVFESDGSREPRVTDAPHLRIAYVFRAVGIEPRQRDAVTATEHMTTNPDAKSRTLGPGESEPHIVDRAKNLGALSDQNRDRKSTRLNSSHLVISYAVFCLKNIHDRMTVLARTPDA